MRCLIYTGGEVFPDLVEERPEPGDLVIAADSGLRTAESFGVRPSILLGDFDSLGEPPSLDGVEILRVPAEKDLTDTQLAVDVALSRGADSIVIIGGLGGAVAECLSEKCPTPLVRHGVNDEFGRSGTAAAVLEAYKLTPEGLCEKIREALAKK